MSIGLTGAIVNNNYNFQSGATDGSTIVLANTDWYVAIVPSSSFAGLTVKMCTTPFDGQVVKALFNRPITTLTLSGNTGQTMSTAAPTTIAAGQSVTAIYRSTNATWYIGS